MLKKCLYLLSAATILHLSLATASEADIIDLQDIDGYGYFQDTSSGFTWMDFDNFLGKSYNELQSLLNGSNFHLATEAELTEMQASAGQPDFGFLSTTMGTSPGGTLIWAYYENGDPSPSSLGHSYITNTGTAWQYATYSLENIKNYKGISLGAWVVNTNQAPAVPTPVPGALWLLGSGVAGLGLVRRKKVTDHRVA